MAPGQTVFNEGDQGQEFFIIEEGQVDCIKGQNVVRTLDKGDHFGELALIRSEPRSLTCKAKT